MFTTDSRNNYKNVESLLLNLFVQSIMTSWHGNAFCVLALWERNPPVTGGFPSHRASIAGFDVSFNVNLNKTLNKQSNRFEISWRSCDVTVMQNHITERYVVRIWLTLDEVWNDMWRFGLLYLGNYLPTNNSWLLVGDRPKRHISFQTSFQSEPISHHIPVTMNNIFQTHITDALLMRRSS